MEDRCRELARAVDCLLGEVEAWQTAELHLLEQAFRRHLSDLGLEPSAEAGATLIAAALFLAGHTPEWGGDARDSLTELAALGRRLLDEQPAA